MTPTRRPGDHFRLRIRGMSREALNWARAQALSEGKTVGHLLNELMYEYRNNVSRSRQALPKARYIDYDREIVTMLNVDRTVWDWLKTQAKAERKANAQLLCELIGRYENLVKATGLRGSNPPGPVVVDLVKPVMASDIPYRAGSGRSRTIYGIHPDLWRLVKTRAKLEHRTMGEFFNDVIDTYKESVMKSGSGLTMTSPYEAVPYREHSVRGVDETLWRWVRTRSILEGYRPQILLGELLYRRVNIGEVPKPVVRVQYRECVMCGTLFEAKRRDSLACSSRCTVALYRARKSGRFPKREGEA